MICRGAASWRYWYLGSVGVAQTGPLQSDVLHTNCKQSVNAASILGCCHNIFVRVTRIENSYPITFWRSEGGLRVSAVPLRAFVLAALCINRQINIPPSDGPFVAGL
jgi:hypothetical protein